jgi:hypothetical protein
VSGPFFGLFRIAPFEKGPAMLCRKACPRHLVPKLLFGNGWAGNSVSGDFRVSRNRVSGECVPKQEFGNEVFYRAVPPFFYSSSATFLLFEHPGVVGHRQSSSWRRGVARRRGPASGGRAEVGQPRVEQFDRLGANLLRQVILGLGQGDWLLTPGDDFSISRPACSARRGRGRACDVESSRRTASHPSKRGGWTPFEAPSTDPGGGRPCPKRAPP